MEFEKYLAALVEHEFRRNIEPLSSRERILVFSGPALNWMGDYIGNAEIRYEKKEVQMDKILFTGASRDWNSILLEKCERSIEKFKALVVADDALREKFVREASFGKEPILLRGPDSEGLYRPFDGMHRLVGAILGGEKTITGYVAIGGEETLPVCEPHVVYDLIRGYVRNARDEQGQEDLYHALSLLVRTYANVAVLLEKRFNEAYVPDKDVQEIIGKILAAKK